MSPHLQTSMLQPLHQELMLLSGTLLLVSGDVWHRAEYLNMAIAFDTSTDAGFTAGVTSKTFAHTCTGANLILFVASWGDIVNDVVTGATYNGVAMTLVGKALESGGRWAYLFSLIAPATGAHNVVISASSSISIAGMSASYTGVRQSSNPDVSTTATPTADSPVTSLTTLANNSWTFLCARNGIGASTAGAGSTLRKSSSNGLAIFDSGGAITPAGSYSMTVTAAGASWALIMASFAPVATTNSNFLAFF